MHIEKSFCVLIVAAAEQSYCIFAHLLHFTFRVSSNAMEYKRGTISNVFSKIAVWLSKEFAVVDAVMSNVL